MLLFSMCGPSPNTHMAPEWRAIDPTASSKDASVETVLEELEATTPETIDVVPLLHFYSLYESGRNKMCSS